MARCNSLGQGPAESSPLRLTLNDWSTALFPTDGDCVALKSARDCDVSGWSGERTVFDRIGCSFMEDQREGGRCFRTDALVALTNLDPLLRIGGEQRL